MCVFYLSFLSVSNLLSFLLFLTPTTHEFSSMSCFNDVMNHVDCVIKRYVYPQKTHSSSKNIRCISVFVLKISVVYQKKYIIGDIG